MKSSDIEFRERVTALGATGGERPLTMLSGAHHRDVSCAGEKSDGNTSGKERTVDAELGKLLRETFGYFLHELNNHRLKPVVV